MPTTSVLWLAGVHHHSEDGVRLKSVVGRGGTPFEDALCGGLPPGWLWGYGTTKLHGISLLSRAIKIQSTGVPVWPALLGGL